jgi:hypothetical protein
LTSCTSTARLLEHDPEERESRLRKKLLAVVTV